MAEQTLKRLRQARKQAGLSQAQVAEIIGVESSATISHWESGSRGIGLDALEQLAGIYGVSMSWLVDGLPIDPDKTRELRELANKFDGFALLADDIRKVADIIDSLTNEDTDD